MDEFEKIKAFSESLAERQQNMEKVQNQPEKEVDLPKYLSQFRAVPPEEEKESKRLLWIVLGLCVLIVVGTVAALLYRLPDMEEEEIVVIAPTPDPVKVLPENPGGLNIPDKDKVVYERVVAAETQPAIENVLPEPEQPLLPLEMIEPEDREDPDLTIPLIEEVTDQGAIMPQKGEEEPQETTEPAKSIEVGPAPEEASAPQIKQEPVSPEPSQKPAKAAAVVWRAQLLSSSSKEKVESSWKEISKKNASLLSDMPYQIISATISGKGTFWRLQVGEFATKEMALNLCSKLKKKKQDCIPVK